MTTDASSTSTTTPYDITITSRRTSSSHSTSTTSSTANGPAHKVHSHPEPVSSSTDPPQYDSFPPFHEERDHERKVEADRRSKIKNYAMEISRLMGRQLVSGMKGVKKGHAPTESQEEEALREARETLAAVEREGLMSPGGRM